MRKAGFQRGNAPVAEVIKGARTLPGRLRVEHPRERKVMAAQIEHRVGRHRLRRLFGSAVDQYACGDFTGPPAQVPGGKTQLVGAVGKLRRVDLADTERRVVGRRCGAVLLRQCGPLVTAGAGNIEPVTHQLQFLQAGLDGGHAADGERGRSGAAANQWPGPCDGRRTAVRRVAHAHALGQGVAEAILVGRADADVDQAGMHWLEVQAAGAIQRDALPLGRIGGDAAHLHGEGLDRAVALRPNGGDHRLPRQRRRARRGADEYLWCIGGAVGHHPQGKRAAARVEAIAGARGQHEIADLAGAGCPHQAPCLGVVDGTFRQVGEADGQRRRLRSAVFVPSLNDCTALRHRNRQSDGFADH